VVLANRSLKSEDVADDPDLLQDPFVMRDMDRAVDRISAAVRKGEQIVVFGDYDVDGVTSTAVILDFLDQVEARSGAVLPDRFRDGYGMKPQGVQQALDAGASLIVTADNGVSSFEAIDLAREAGVDVVVIDHHQAQDRLPNAVAVVNPNRPDCDYAFKGLAAVGVAFKVVQALSESLMEGDSRRSYLNSLLDLVALGTVADMAPMLGENRLLTRRGLQVLEGSRRPGVEALKSVAGMSGRRVDTTAIGFFLGPRINSAGRLASADLALNLLRSQSRDEAERLADRLNQLNVRRQEMQKTGVAEAEAQVEELGLQDHRILVVRGDAWHLGVVGLIAGRLMETYSRPAAACTAVRKDGTFTGSARTAGGYNIVEAIFRCADLLTEYGGHADAAGFTGPVAQFDAFRERLEADADRALTDEDITPWLELDVVLQPSDVSLDMVSRLSAISPFGSGNETPRFMVSDCRIERSYAVGSGAHLKLSLDTGAGICDAIWWRHGELIYELSPGDRVDVAGALEENTWNGRTQVQLVLDDMRPAELDHGP
jgi:single-stranded-DNA-specific exonuclease